MNYTERLSFRVLPEEAAVLRHIQQTYGLPSLSAAARQAIRQVAVDRRRCHPPEGERP